MTEAPESKDVLALNTASGQVGVVPRTYLTHPVLGLTLVEVPGGTKSYEPEKYKPTTAAEYAKEHKGIKAPKLDDFTLDVAVPSAE